MEFRNRKRYPVLMRGKEMNFDYPRRHQALRIEKFGAKR